TAVSFPFANQSSPSSRATIWPCSSGNAALKADACPPFSFRTYFTRGANLRMIDGVRSFDPASTTTISSSSCDNPCSRTLTRACSMYFSWLKVSVSAVTRGFILHCPRHSFRALHELLDRLRHQYAIDRGMTQRSYSTHREYLLLGRETLRSPDRSDRPYIHEFREQQIH